MLSGCLFMGRFKETRENPATENTSFRKRFLVEPSGNGGCSFFPDFLFASWMFYVDPYNREFPFYTGVPSRTRNPQATLFCLKVNTVGKQAENQEGRKEGERASQIWEEKTVNRVRFFPLHSVEAKLVVLHLIWLRYGYRTPTMMSGNSLVSFRNVIMRRNSEEYETHSY